MPGPGVRVEVVVLLGVPVVLLFFTNVLDRSARRLIRVDVV